MKKYLLILLLFILILFSFVYLLKIAFAGHIKVKFSELRPFHSYVPVYYKGVKVGKVLSRNHTKDYKHTILTLVIYPNDLKLPAGTVAYLKRHKFYNYFKQDYIEIVFPKEKTDKFLTNNSIIEGVATIDLSDFSANQNLDEIEKIKDDLAQSAENLNYAIGGLSMLFETVNDILLENKTNLHSTTKNVSSATSNFSNVTKKIDNSINQQKLNSTFDSIAKATENIDATTNSMDLNMPNLTSTICNLQDITADTSAITKGVRKTLSKPFGGLRLLFGRSVQDVPCP